MLFKRIIAVCSNNHINPLNRLCGQNAILFIIRVGGPHGYYWLLKAKAVPLHATKALVWIGGIAPTHYLPRH
jgi:hypothetical protein